MTAGNGDTAYSDTILIISNDPDRDSIRLPIRISVNEPPFLVKDSILFVGAVPPLAKVAKAYVPDHAVYQKVGLVFSERIDTNTISVNSFAVYSQLDSLRFVRPGADTLVPIPGTCSVRRALGSRFDTLFFVPACSTGNYISPHFGIKALDGYFISTDVIRIRVGRGIRDLAGNVMDLNHDRKPDVVGAFKIESALTDSGSFKVESTTPANGSESKLSTPVITVDFTSPIDSLSVDTAIVGNRSIRIMSSFGTTPIALTARPRISGNRLSFSPSGLFFGNESISVTLSASIRDQYHGTLDGNRDGLGAFFYAYGRLGYAMADSFITGSASFGDNYSFSFRSVPQEFYFYPCPYEPGRNARHQAQGGIIFKNLQALVTNATTAALHIRIYDVAGDLVYSTTHKNEVVPCKTTGTPPMWRWGAVNDDGKAVASGLYLFVISDDRDKEILNRGKLMVIR